MRIRGITSANVRHGTGVSRTCAQPEGKENPCANGRGAVAALARCRGVYVALTVSDRVAPFELAHARPLQTEQSSNTLLQMIARPDPHLARCADDCLDAREATEDERVARTSVDAFA